MSSPKLTGLTAYAGDYSDQLLTQLYVALELEAAGITVINNLKSKLTLPKLLVDPALKPYTGKFVSKDDISAEDRTLEVFKAQSDRTIEPSKYLATWLEKKRAKGENAKNMDIPFASVMWPAVIDELAQEVAQGTIYHGKGKAAFAAYNSGTVYHAGDLIKYTQDSELRYFEVTATTTAGQTPDSNPEKFKWAGAKALAVGFGGVLDAEETAGHFTPVSTGAITSTDAYGQFTSVWRKLPEMIRKKGGLVYCSQDSYECLLDDYENKVKKNFEETNGTVYLAKTEKKAILKPVSWLSGSGKIIASAPGNFWMGTDQTDDMNVIKTIEQMYTIDAGITFMIGMQIADINVVATNDQD
jgi:hypothetical protein